MQPLSNAAVLIAVLTAVASAAGTWGMIAWAHSRNLIDTPNHRSSHSRPTPRGGGVALVGAFYGGLLALGAMGALDTSTLLLLATGLPIAIIGYIDDARSLSARLRLVVQLLCAAGFLALLPTLPPLTILGYASPPALTFAVYMLGLVWLTNLYNFMDGIDGIAAGQAIAACFLWALVLLPEQAAALPLVLAAAALGFLRFNFPPARIFMGDVGSAFCGFIIGALALLHARESDTSPLLWLMPLAPFIADATLTLAVRILRGQRPSEAHRSHAYQRLARKAGCHLPVSAGYFLLACIPVGLVFWWTAQHHATHANAAFLAVVAILMAIAASLGAGRDSPH